MKKAMTESRAEKLVKEGLAALAECDRQLKKSRKSLAAFRRVLIELKETEGWAFLRDRSGKRYPSWRACVSDRFEVHQSTCYRAFKAGEIELECFAQGEIGTIEERKLRPLSGLKPKDRQAVVDKAFGSGRVPTHAEVKATVVQRLRTGDVSPEEKLRLVTNESAQQADEAAAVNERSKIVHVSKALDLVESLNKSAVAMHQKAKRADRHLIKYERLAIDTMKLSAKLVARLREFLMEQGIILPFADDEELRPARRAA